MYVTNRCIGCHHTMEVKRTLCAKSRVKVSASPPSAVHCSLFSPWDRQFYPDMLKQGSQLLRINVDTEHGGLSIDEVHSFLRSLCLLPQHRHSFLEIATFVHQTPCACCRTSALTLAKSLTAQCLHMR